MTIIKNGIIPENNNVRRFECLRCGCIFEAVNTPGEAPEWQISDAIELRRFGIEAYAICPCCGKWVYRGSDGRFCK